MIQLRDIEIIVQQQIEALEADGKDDPLLRDVQKILYSTEVRKTWSLFLKYLVSRFTIRMVLKFLILERQPTKRRLFKQISSNRTTFSASHKLQTIPSLIVLAIFSLATTNSFSSAAYYSLLLSLTSYSFLSLRLYLLGCRIVSKYRSCPLRVTFRNYPSQPCMTAQLKLKTVHANATSCVMPLTGQDKNLEHLSIYQYFMF